MTDTYYEAHAQKRLRAAEAWAQRLERERPSDHRAIAQAWAHVRRLKALWRTTQ